MLRTKERKEYSWFLNCDGCGIEVMPERKVKKFSKWVGNSMGEEETENYKPEDENFLCSECERVLLAEAVKAFYKKPRKITHVYSWQCQVCHKEQKYKYKTQGSDFDKCKKCLDEIIEKSREERTKKQEKVGNW